MERGLRQRVRSLAAARRVVARWRELTGGAKVRDPQRRTLVACSGGADSIALAIVLASASPKGVVLGHVVHDLRASREAEHDRDHVRNVAAGLGLTCVERAVQVRREGKNAEAAARRLRYAALLEIAREAQCSFIATAHQADDQLETLLMRMSRGTGPLGLAGVHEKRELDGGGGTRVTLIRPMLVIRRLDAEAICDAAGVSFVTDATNADGSRMRAALRATVTPAIVAIAPDAAEHACALARMMADVAAVIEAEASRAGERHAMGSAACWRRSGLATEPTIVRGEILRQAYRQLRQGRGLDRLSQAMVMRAAGAIGDGERRPRIFRWPGMVLSVGKDRVELRLAASSGAAGQGMARGVS
jgi:tRNA(Ile)-lysidine synthase